MGYLTLASFEFLNDCTASCCTMRSESNFECITALLLQTLNLSSDVDYHHTPPVKDHRVDAQNIRSTNLKVLLVDMSNDNEATVIAVRCPSQALQASALSRIQV